VIRLSELGGANVNKNEEYEKVISRYYGDEQVSAIIMLKVDTKEADAVAKKVTQFDKVEDVFMVTGDVDIICKVKFANYKELKGFVLESLAGISGIKDTKTQMVVTTFKEAGKAITEPKGES
jgi:Lrp/AsnC family leucine-responsive transcriptional regulator